MNTQGIFDSDNIQILYIYRLNRLFAVIRIKVAVNLKEVEPLAVFLRTVLRHAHKLAAVFKHFACRTGGDGIIYNASELRRA